MSCEHTFLTISIPLLMTVTLLPCKITISYCAEKRWHSRPKAAILRKTRFQGWSLPGVWELRFEKCSLNPDRIKWLSVPKLCKQYGLC